MVSGGTLVFQVVTRGKVPVFLTSSFAFIEPIIYGVETWGTSGTLCGLAAAGVIYILLSLLIRWQGRDIIKRALPPVVVGPVIMVIGLTLAPVVVHMAIGRTGDVALTRAFNPAVMTRAAIFVVAFAFVGKLGALLQTIPVPVMGGIMLLLFGAIMVVDLNSLVQADDDLMEPRNLTIVALILVFGIGGMSSSIGKFTLAGIGLAGILGVILNLVLPKRRED